MQKLPLKASEIPSIALTSTVVATDFQPKASVRYPLSEEAFKAICKHITSNYCGHPVTLQLLEDSGIQLPEAQKGKFWDGQGWAVAARPKGGTRGTSHFGDTQVSALSELEFCIFAEVEAREASMCSSTFLCFVSNLISTKIYD